MGSQEREREGREREKRRETERKGGIERERDGKEREREKIVYECFSLPPRTAVQMWPHNSTTDLNSFKFLLN